MGKEPKTYQEIFSKLITESETILIEYEHKLSYFKEDSFISFTIKNVNGCTSDHAFKNRVQNIAKEGIENLNNELKNLNKEDKLALLEECRDEIWWLRDLVEDKTQVFEENEYGPTETHNFKGFSSASFKGTKDDKIKSYELSILRKASDYAIAWIEAIEATKQKIDFITYQIELLPNEKKTMKSRNDKYLFYSWQSDRDDLRKHIWKALSNVKKDFKRENINLHIDSDMRNSPGGQDISTTLFSKINDCDIFLADVILTGDNSYRDKDKPEKKSSNPNVLLELGYAAGKIGWDKIIMVINIDKDKIEDLPFDIRNRSVLWYKSDEIIKLQTKLKEFIETIINSS